MAITLDAFNEFVFNYCQDTAQDQSHWENCKNCKKVKMAST